DGEHDRRDHRDQVVFVHLMHGGAVDHFHLEDVEAHQDHAGDVEVEPAETIARDAFGAVHLAKDQNERADVDGYHSGGEHHVGRAKDLDVEAVGVVPPIVEGCGGEHGDAAPGGDEGAERAAETPEGDAGFAQGGIA